MNSNLPSGGGLNPSELDVRGRRERAAQGGLAAARHVLQQHVTATDQRTGDQPNDVVTATHDTADPFDERDHQPVRGVDVDTLPGNGLPGQLIGRVGDGGGGVGHGSPRGVGGARGGPPQRCRHTIGASRAPLKGTSG
jgi:hypothetical protein